MKTQPDDCHQLSPFCLIFLGTAPPGTGDAGDVVFAGPVRVRFEESQTAGWLTFATSKMIFFYDLLHGFKKIIMDVRAKKPQSGRIGKFLRVLLFTGDFPSP